MNKNEWNKKHIQNKSFSDLIIRVNVGVYGGFME